MRQSRVRGRVRGVICAAAIFLVSSLFIGTGTASAEPDYLTFQIFTDANPQLWSAPTVYSRIESRNMNFALATKTQIAGIVQDIVQSIGTSGTASHKLGFMVGPIALEYTDAQIRTLIQNAFDVAREEQVAVGFHIDDSMFWYRRSDLWNDSRNVEWLDWAGTPSTGRRLDWTAEGTRLAPQMCYNAPVIVAEVSRIARDVIGAEIRLHIDELERTNQQDLFAGLIVGWETELGRDFATDRPLGYCGLANKGYSQAVPPADMDAAREDVVREFIGLWSAGLSAAGIDSDKLYSHTAFISPVEHAAIVQRDPTRDESFSEINNFAPARVAFGPTHKPGFSTYPAPGLHDHLYEELLLRPEVTGWASSEGTNISIGMSSGEATMESYLARHFNHGATLVNVSGWGVADANNPFRQATESTDAIAAYRKFLNGQSLVEVRVANPAQVMHKVDTAQQHLLAWLQAGGNPQLVETDLLDLWTHLQAGRLVEAETAVDRLIATIRPAP